jgi:tight adherence protein B
VTASVYAAAMGMLLGAALILGREGAARAAADWRFQLIERSPSGPDAHAIGPRRREAPTTTGLVPKWVERAQRGDLWLVVLAGPAGFVGMRLAGPIGLVLGVVSGAMLPRVLKRRHEGERAAKLERQLAEVVETCSLAVRAGLSIAQALDFAANEAEAPMNQVLSRALEEQRVGAPFETALLHFGESLATEDARLFVLVVSTHARSGGNLAGALDEVVSAIRHRMEVRRELRALSAQGRVSGAILGSLPIAFFLVIAGTSHRELGPVYRSPAGIGMVAAGLLMEAVAYVWIRRLIRVQA